MASISRPRTRPSKPMRTRTASVTRRAASLDAELAHSRETGLCMLERVRHVVDRSFDRAQDVETTTVGVQAPREGLHLEQGPKLVEMNVDAFELGPQLGRARELTEEGAPKVNLLPVGRRARQDAAQVCLVDGERPIVDAHAQTRRDEVGQKELVGEGAGIPGGRRKSGRFDGLCQRTAG